ncbi:YraN family protein [bacterium]|nr:YraN family protein [bacterium]|tara:strand:+ start:5209 stop:5583 length:375 start_codon:yes stop_codon:yes gene_type:complete
MKSKNRETGDKGEDIAVQHLEKNGFTVLGRNYLKPWGELDIIAAKKGVIHFVEVKSISVKKEGDFDYNPLFNITKQKKDRLRRIIQTYLREEGKEDEDYQVDAIAVYLKEGEVDEMEHLEDILL